MKLTNEEIYRAREPLEKLLNERFPVKISYRLAIMARKINSQCEIIDTVKNGLIETYGEVDRDNPKHLEVKPESKNFTKFIGEMEELFAQEVEFVLEKIALPTEIDGKEICIEPSVLVELEKLIGA